MERYFKRPLNLARFLKHNPTIFVYSTDHADAFVGEPGDCQNCPAFDKKSGKCYHAAWFKGKSKGNGAVVGPFYKCPREATTSASTMSSGR